MSAIDHPTHYGGADDPYEAIKVIEAWELGFCLGNSIKYISRAGKKDPTKTIEDLKKARWYLDREIKRLEKHEQELTFGSSPSNVEVLGSGSTVSKVRTTGRAEGEAPAEPEVGLTAVCPNCSRSVDVMGEHWHGEMLFDRSGYWECQPKGV